MKDLSIHCLGALTPSYSKVLEKFIHRVLEYCKCENYEISLGFASLEEIQKINKEFRNKDYATDVISFEEENFSFDEEEGVVLRGDIIISLEFIQENAVYFGVNFTNELLRVLVHGLLHLQGWDHATNEPDQEMLILQESILKILELEFINEENHGFI